MGERDDRMGALGFWPDYYVPQALSPWTEPLLFDEATGLVYTSPQAPFHGDRLVFTGKVPLELTVEDAMRAAALCAANVLRAVRRQFGTLDRVERVLRLVAYVNSETGFSDAHRVADGASRLLYDVFGPAAGWHTRAALVVAHLSQNAAVEVEMVLKMGPGARAVAAARAAPPPAAPPPPVHAPPPPPPPPPAAPPGWGDQ